MTIESATYISDLNASYPESGSAKSQGDDHLRLVKATIKATWPAITGAVTASHTELGYVYGVTGPLQAQLNLKAPLASPAFTGTVTGEIASFTGNVSVAYPTINGHAATKLYVDTVAFAAALPAQTGKARQVVTTDGSAGSFGPLFGAAQYKTTTTSAQAHQRYNIDTSGGAWTLTLPASPSADDWVWIVDIAGACAIYPVTIARNGSNIMGLAEDMDLNVNYGSALLIYNTTKGWVLS